RLPAPGDAGRHRGDCAQQHLRLWHSRRRKERDPSRRGLHEPEALRRHQDSHAYLPARRLAHRNPLRQGSRRGRNQGRGKGAWGIGRAQGGGGVKVLSIALASLLRVAALALLPATLEASAQDYPSRPITVVVPFPAGGPSDVVARIVTEQMGRILGQALVIENVGGAGGTIGSAQVAAARSDGYTLLAGSMGSHVAAPVLTPNPKYDSERDFAPIGSTAQSPALIVPRKDFPANNRRPFANHLKQ